MPICFVEGREGPFDIFFCQPVFHERIVGDIRPVIIVNKLMIFYLPVRIEGEGDEQQAYQTVEPYVKEKLFLPFGLCHKRTCLVPV
jgi:hypothetical protein